MKRAEDGVRAEARTLVSHIIKVKLDNKETNKLNIIMKIQPLEIPTIVAIVHFSVTEAANKYRSLRSSNIFSDNDEAGMLMLLSLSYSS